MGFILLSRYLDLWKLKEMIVIVYSLFLIWLEVYIIDPYFWKKGKSDKPLSTIIFIVLSSLVMVFGVWMLLIPIVVRACLFDPILNYSGNLPSGKRKLCYHSTNNKKGFALWWENFWMRFPCWLEISIRISLIILVVWIVK